VSHRVRRRHVVYDGGQVDGNGLPRFGSLSAILANPTTMMLDAWIANSQLEGLFEPHLSTDRVRAFMPDPRAYQMGVDAFVLDRRNIVFAAFAGWNVAGAKGIRLSDFLGQSSRHASRGTGDFGR
jgi:hypothetical protein